VLGSIGAINGWTWATRPNAMNAEPPSVRRRPSIEDRQSDGADNAERRPPPRWASELDRTESAREDRQRFGHLGAGKAAQAAVQARAEGHRRRPLGGDVEAVRADVGGWVDVARD